MKQKHLTLNEYCHIGIGDKKEPYKDGSSVFLPEEEFKAIDSFVRQKDDDEEASFFLTPSYRNGKNILKAKNYVGLIQTKQGTVIEILPKIHNDEDEKDTRKHLLLMLKCLKESPFKKFSTANLKTEKMNLLEIFITMFLAELADLVRKGLKRDYAPIEENSVFIKGKILWNENIKYNLVHKERNFIRYDEFMENIPENRIIKTTLLFLKNISKTEANQKSILEHLFIFDGVATSDNIHKDFSSCKTDRISKKYENILIWCRTFLENKTFTSQRGDEIAFSLLFPMEKIFEAYVAKYIKNNFPAYKITIQDRNHWLVEDHDGSTKFRIEPDIVIEKEKEIIIADTKWKLLDTNKSNYSISQADMYQLYAYGKKYQKQHTYKTVSLFLIYPLTDNFSEPLPPFSFCEDDKELVLKAIPFDIKESFNSNEPFNIKSLIDN